jgi:hypothetical protein
LASTWGDGCSLTSLQQAADAMWANSTTFGPHTPAQWLELSRHMVKPVPGTGAVTLHYDPAIAVPFGAMTQESQRRAKPCCGSCMTASLPKPAAARRESDLLSRNGAQMMQRGPKARLVEFAGVGHAPTLIAPTRCEAVASFCWT